MSAFDVLPRGACAATARLTTGVKLLTLCTTIAAGTLAYADPPNIVWMKGGHRGLRTIDITPDGQTVVTGGADDETIKIWNAADGTLLRTINAFLGAVNDLDISPDGQFVAAAADIAIGSGDPQVKIFRISDGDLVQPVDIGFANATQIAYSPDGTKLAIGSANGLFFFADPADGSVDQPIESNFDLGVAALAYAPDGLTIAVGGQQSFSGTVKRFNVANGGLAGTITDSGAFSVNALAYSPDGTRLAMGSIFSGAVHVRQVSNGALVQTLTSPRESVWSIAYSPDGLHVAVGGDIANPTPPPFSLGRVDVYNAQTGSIEHPLDGTAFSVAFSADNTRVLAGGADSLGRMWDVSSGNLLMTFGFFSAPVGGAAFSPGGLTVASGAYDQSVRIWNAADGTIVHDLVGHQDVLNAVTYSPEGDILASGGGAGGFDTVDPSIKLWNTTTGALIHTLAGHTGGTFALAFCHDGQTLASGGSEISGTPRGTLKLWRVSDGLLLRTINIPQQNPVSGVAWTPDDELVATVRNDIRFWHVSDGTLDHTIATAQSLDAIAMAPDGLTIAGSSQVFNTARIWNVTTGTVVGSFVGPPDGVGLSSITFSTDGQTLASASGYMRALYFWNVEDQTLVDSFDQEAGWGISPVPAPLALAPTGGRFFYGRSDAAIVLADRSVELDGDLNCDGAVNLLDVEPFALALVDPAAYADQFPSCDADHADMNNDSLEDGLDIPGFTNALLAP